MSAPLPQGAAKPLIAYELRESRELQESLELLESHELQKSHELRQMLLTNFMTYPPANPREDRRIQKPKTSEYYQTIMSQFSNLVLIATFAGGVQVAVLSLMNDLLSSPEHRLLQVHERGAYYSLDSLGIFCGILAVALNLAIAVVAGVNAALASQLSLRPEQKAPNIEGRFISCMVVIFSTAAVSATSLIMLFINVDTPFTFCVGTLFLSGVVISIVHVSESFDLDWLKSMKMTPLSTSSLFLSSLTFVLAAIRPDTTIWLTIPSYCFVLTYHSLVDIQNMPYRRGKWDITFVFILCLWWMVFSFMPYVLKSGDKSYAIAFGVAAGLEAITLASIGIVGSWKRHRWMRVKRRRIRSEMNLAEA